MNISNSELSYLQSISNCVDEHLKSKDPVVSQNMELVKVIERCLGHMVPSMKFKVCVVKTFKTENPAIMAIYPDMGELSSRIPKLMELMEKGNRDAFMKEWNSIKTWHIEIDSNLLNPKSNICVDDGDQFVALLSHELGHSLAGSPVRLVENYVYMQKTSYRLNQLLSIKNPWVRKLMIPMFVHTLQFHVILNKGKDLKEEIRCDHYVANEYREALLSYLENHILNNPNVSKIVVDKEEFDARQNTSITFSKEIIYLIQKRRDALKSTIKAQYDDSNSPYLKELVQEIGRKSMGYDPEKDMTNAVVENATKRHIEMDLEDCMGSITHLLETASVTPRDISILQIQVDDIQTVDQKLFVVHTIYDYLDILQAQKEKLLKKSAPTVVQDAQIRQLNDILGSVMKKNVSDVGDRYGVFIKYPKGYEG